MNSRLLRSSLVLTTLAGLALGCGDSSPPEGTASKLTYWDDIAPLLHQKCVTCHQPGGIGPFSMLEYKDVVPKAANMAALTRAKLMPPYLVTHDGTCGQFEDSAALSQPEIDKLQAWASAPLVEGKKVTLTAPPVAHLAGGTDLKTPSVVPMPAGTDIARFDDYRCFTVDAQLTKDRFITGYEVLPGNAAIVHHVLAFIVDPSKQTRSGKTNREIIQALDAADPDRVGWSCFAGAGDGVEDTASPVVWAPGQGVTTYPANIGVRQKPTDQVVIQIHYNLVDERTRGQSDSTTVRMLYADTVERPALFVLPDGLLESLFVNPEMPDLLPARNPAYRYTWTKTMEQMGLAGAPPLEVIAVMPHMHERGRKLEMRFLGAGGRNECQAKVEDWNFHWQKFYFYKGTRPMLTPDTKIEVSCTYDTSRDTMATVPGWGTQNEMCLSTLIVALPPGS